LADINASQVGEQQEESQYINRCISIRSLIRLSKSGSSAEFVG